MMAPYYRSMYHCQIPEKECDYDRILGTFGFSIRNINRLLQNSQQNCYKSLGDNHNIGIQYG